MAASAKQGIGGMLVVLAALVAAHVRAEGEAPAYRCGAHTYSQLACPGGRPIGLKPHRETDKYKTPPQDRAIAIRRAALSPQDRAQCRALDVELRQEERRLRARGEPLPTLEEDTPFTRVKKRSRDLRC